jgi:hypothetical protein
MDDRQFLIRLERAMPVTPDRVRRHRCVAWLAGLLLLAACSTTPHPPPPPGPATPDLSGLVAGLTAADLSVQEAALAPAVRAAVDETPGILPPGSTLVLKPETWRAIAIDQTGSPTEGVIAGSLTRPGQPAVDVTLHVVNLGGHWLLAETSPA